MKGFNDYEEAIMRWKTSSAIRHSYFLNVGEESYWHLRNTCNSLTTLITTESYKWLTAAENRSLWFLTHSRKSRKTKMKRDERFFEIRSVDDEINYLHRRWMMRSRSRSLTRPARQSRAFWKFVTSGWKIRQTESPEEELQTEDLE